MNRRGFLLGLVTAPAAAMLPDIVRPSLFSRAAIATARTLLDRLPPGSLYYDLASGALYVGTSGAWEPVTDLCGIVAGRGAPLDPGAHPGYTDP